MEILRVKEDGSEELLATMGPGAYFGELAPALRLPRTASAQATEPTVLSAMGVPEFRERLSR